jgi:tetratricopeptide (TPR) repeat protein
MRSLSVYAALTLALAAVAPAAAQEDPRARIGELVAGGRYGDAEDLLARELERSPGDPELAATLAAVLLEVGRYEDAGKAARKGGADARCLTLLAESSRTRGRYDEAMKAVQAALAKTPRFERARYELGMLRLDLGEREKALDAFNWFFDHYAENEIDDPEALTLVAAASVRAAELEPEVEMDFKITKDLLLRDVWKKHPDHVPAMLELGDLYMAIYQDQDAKKWYRKVLKMNPRNPRALYGIAMHLAFHFNDPEAEKKCREVLQTNPNHFEAKEAIARVRIGDSEYDEAEKLLEEVLAVNPKRMRPRGLLAVIDFMKADRKEFETKAARLLADDKRYARIYRDLSDVLEDHRRFEEAAEWAKKATETDPKDHAAWWALGRNLVHLAKEGEARKALETSRRLDPFGHYWGNFFRDNMVEVLGHLEEFVESKSSHFVYRIHGGENTVLSKYYHHFMERSWSLLTEKYGFEPEGPILTEVFHVHDDFAARTIGLPGIGALGACFGKVITLDSPSARDPGAFTWASTAHHEFAHVMTLQMSKGRVPRWFTEGLSVYEERQYADWWERDMDWRLYDAWRNDEIFPIAKFNSKFRGKDVMFAYYLGGMMCEFIVDEFGFEKILEMLEAYGEDQQTPAVLKTVLGVTTEEYDRRFEEWVGRYVGGWKITPRWSDDTLKAMVEKRTEDPDDLEVLVKLAWAFHQRGNRVDAMSHLGRALDKEKDDPRLILLRGEVAYRSGRFDKAKSWYETFLAKGEDDLALRLHLAEILEQSRDYEGAVAQYEAAKACFPRYAGDKNPYLELARLKGGGGDFAGAMVEIESYVRLANTDIRRRMELADWYEERGEWEKLSRILNEVVEIYPLDPKSSEKVHARLAAVRARLSDLTGAALEYEVALELGVTRSTEPEVRVGLGEVYHLLGRLRDARHQARAALEIDAEYGPAKELLERIAER